MGNITIDRYFDRIVMSNPGTMLVSLDEFYEGGHSICRNPVLQKMFIFIGVGEKGGSGADVIGKGWKDNGWLLPTMSEHSHPDRTETTLPLPGGLVENSEKLGENQEELVEKLPENQERWPENTEKLVERLPENQERLPENQGGLPEKLLENSDRLSVTLTENRRKILCMIIDNPSVSLEEMSLQLSISVTAVKKNISAMRDKLIRRIGPDKGGRWEVINHDVPD